MAISGWIPDLMKERQREIQCSCDLTVHGILLLLYRLSTVDSSQQPAASSMQHTAAADPQLSSLWKNRLLGVAFFIFNCDVHVHRTRTPELKCRVTECNFILKIRLTSNCKLHTSRNILHH